MEKDIELYEKYLCKYFPVQSSDENENETNDRAKDTTNLEIPKNESEQSDRTKDGIENLEGAKESSASSEEAKETINMNNELKDDEKYVETKNFLNQVKRSHSNKSSDEPKEDTSDSKEIVTELNKKEDDSPRKESDIVESHIEDKLSSQGKSQSDSLIKEEVDEDFKKMVKKENQIPTSDEQNLPETSAKAT